MASCVFDVPFRKRDDAADNDGDADSFQLSDSPTLIHPNKEFPSLGDIPRDREEHRRHLFLRRRFSSKWTQKKEALTDTEARGPLGLRLLVASAEPLIDIIFVHGLRGGSIKTWQKGTDPRLFWPQHWLPTEPEFRNASIHTFGYDSDWKSSEPSVLSIHDFGQALYEEMRSSPTLRRNAKSPIVLVGHSMGGLVIKKAYILAHQDSPQSEIYHRIRSIFFLATPHRGSDYAAILNNILKLSELTGLSSSREYVKDLKIGSISAQLINEEFGKCADQLHVYSFYETLQTNLGGVSSSIIVDKNSAILVLGIGKQERATYLTANHGNVCKFKDPGDSNYLKLKNSLGTVVDTLLKDGTVSSWIQNVGLGINRFAVLLKNEVTSAENLRSLKSLLAISDHFNDQYERLEGSCTWIEDLEEFTDWRDLPNDLLKSQKYKPTIFWVTANPGVGKTMLVTHVVSQLKEFGLQPAAYYFHFGKKESQSLAGFLRSIAFQMAGCNAAVRESLAELRADSSAFDLDDASATWSRIFQARIFQTPILTPQYWIIDAIDECIKYAEFFSLLKRTPIGFPLKIFITSRKLPDISKLTRPLDDVTFYLADIPILGTLNDIKLYVRNRMMDVAVDSDEKKEVLTKEIIAKAQTSFLWARLVMDELEGVYGYESILQVLQGIPEGMMSYYQRTVTEMAENKREKHIAKAILHWVVIAARPLTVSELCNALELDIKTHLSSPKMAIEGLCGHFVTIEQEANLVRLVHATAREFLFSEEAGEFRISKSEVQQRIAMTCLTILTGPDMQPPRHRRALEIKRTKPEPALLDYAIAHFSDHVFSASASKDDLLEALVKFLSTTTLTWIEKMARKGDMHQLVRTAKNLRAYLDRRSKYSSPLDRHFICIDAWATDLSRLAIKFGKALLTSPQSIHFLLPPLCPSKTALYRQMRRAPDSLSLVGPNQQSWDDCIATLNFGEETGVTVAGGNNLIAVAFESGLVRLYNHKTYETEALVQTDFAVDHVHFDPQGSFFVTSDRRCVSLWDMQGTRRWRNRIRSNCILLYSHSTIIFVVTQQGKAFQWDVETGDLLEENLFVYESPEGSHNDHAKHTRAPSAASVSPKLELLALAYRNGPVCLFDLQSNELIGWAIDERSRAPEQLIFNPNPSVELLLVAYNESHLALYDSWSGALVETQEAEKNAIYNSVTCSPNGQTFATVDIRGTLRLWDFESLTLRYHVITPQHSFRLLNFTSDGINLLDMVDHEMKIWSPPALISKAFEEEASTSDLPEVTPVTEGQFELLRSSKIEAVAAHPSLPIIAAGKNNGDVVTYKAIDGQQTAVLYSHQDTVNCIALSKNCKLASSDLVGVVQLWELQVPCSGAVSVAKLVFNLRFSTSIRQLLFDQTGDHLLISMDDVDKVYRTTDGNLTGSLEWNNDQRTFWKWTVGLSIDEQSGFALIYDHTIKFFDSSKFRHQDTVYSFLLDYDVGEGSMDEGINSAMIHPETKRLVLDVRRRQGYSLKSQLYIFDLSESEERPQTSRQPIQTPVSDMTNHFLGFSSDKSLIVLSRDSWICSFTMSGVNTREYSVHSFVLSEFTSTSGNILPTQTINDGLVFCLYDKVAILNNALKYQEKRLLK
ncbi:hypothetical protein S40293_10153 [Stachybotrys chartarum IBT 40293]|nr:hypothetical protein S40293_10153 [Stachybotrys chartarum IBT 40293]